MANSAVVLSNFVYHTLRISTPTMLESLVNRVRGDVCDARLLSWGKAMNRVVDLELEVQGRDNVDPNEIYVVMSNHASHYDVPVLFEAMPLRFRMAGKAELFRVPIWGQALRASGFPEIDRKNRKAAIESLERAKEFMRRERISIWIAPEGTSSKDGVLGPFKQGGFHTAIDAGLKILPVTIVGSNDVYRKGTLDFHSGKHVTVVFHPPIDSKAYGHPRRAELMADVRTAIASALPEPLRGHESK